MPKSQPIRFAAGCPAEPWSCVWRLVVRKNDVFLWSSKTAMGVLKISLHESGVWVLAATEQSGATFGGNRRARQWQRPREHAPGITRGPSILVPHTSFATPRFLPEDGGKEISWFTGPEASQMVEFTLYYVESGRTPAWGTANTLLRETQLANGSRVSIVACRQPTPTHVRDAAEGLLRTQLVPMADSRGHKGGAFFWVTSSGDELQTPFVVDLPIPIGYELGGRR